MSNVAYFPGKMGDALLQWPVLAEHISRTGKKFEVWLDEKTCTPLKPLFEVQEGIIGTRLVNRSKDYSRGGQPWDGAFSTEDHISHAITSMGMREIPQRQITLQTAMWVPFQTDMDALRDNVWIWTGPVQPANRLVLHGTFRGSHGGGAPGFWRFLAGISEGLMDTFEEITFVGTGPERQRALEIYPDWKDFADDGNFLTLAKHIAASRCVISCGSCVAALAGLLKVPCVRVHDPIGDMPKVLWSNLGDNQANETENDLRKGLWGEFRNRWLAPKVLQP